MRQFLPLFCARDGIDLQKRGNEAPGLRSASSSAKSTTEPRASRSQKDEGERGIDASRTADSERMARTEKTIFFRAAAAAAAQVLQIASRARLPWAIAWVPIPFKNLEKCLDAAPGESERSSEERPVRERARKEGQRKRASGRRPPQVHVARRLFDARGPFLTGLLS